MRVRKGVALATLGSLALGGWLVWRWTAKDELPFAVLQRHRARLAWKTKPMPTIGPATLRIAYTLKQQYDSTVLELMKELQPSEGWRVTSMEFRRTVFRRKETTGIQQVEIYRGNAGISATISPPPPVGYFGSPRGWTTVVVERWSTPMERAYSRLDKSTRTAPPNTRPWGCIYQPMYKPLEDVSGPPDKRLTVDDLRRGTSDQESARCVITATQF